MYTIENFRRKIGKLDKKERLLYLEMLSRKRVTKYGPFPETKVNAEKTLYNHEIEVIAFNSVIVPNKPGYIIDKNKWLASVAKVIGDQKHFIKIENKHGRSFLATFASFYEFPGQSSYNSLYYRFNYIYNLVKEKIDVKKEFVDKFGISFNELMMIIIQIQHWALNWDNNLTFNDFITQYLGEENIRKLSFLIKNADDFGVEYNKISSNDEYLSFIDLNLLIKYPFIEYEGIYYCPYVPYIVYAATESLMFRITENNDPIRGVIGKEVIEEYAYHIFKGFNDPNFIKVEREFEYRKGVFSSDVVLMSNEDILFVEVKFLNQSLKLRALDRKTIEGFQGRLVDAIRQVYVNMLNYKTGKMGDNVTGGLEPFGLVLMYEDFYFEKDMVYEEALKEINPKYDSSVTKEYLIKKVLILPLYFAELILKGSSINVIDYVKNELQKPKGYRMITRKLQGAVKSEKSQKFNGYWKRVFEEGKELYEKNLKKKEL